MKGRIFIECSSPFFYRFEDNEIFDNPETYIMAGSPIFGTDITKSCYQIFHYPRIYKRKGKNIL